MNKPKFVAFLIFFCYLSFPINAQDEITLSSNGEIISAPIRIKQNKSLAFSIKSDDQAIADAIAIRNRLLFMDNLLNSTTEQEALLLKEEVELYSFFKYNDTKGSCGYTFIEALNKEGNISLDPNEIQRWDSLLSTKEYRNINKTNCLTQACICSEADIKLKRFKEVRSLLFDFKLKKRLARDLLCVEQQEKVNLFQIRTPNKLGVNPIIYSEKCDFRPNVIIPGFTYLLDSKGFHVSQDGKTYKAKAIVNKKANFQVKKVNSFHQTLINWHNTHKSLINQKDLDEYSDYIKNDYTEINKLEEAIKVTDLCTNNNFIQLGAVLVKYDKLWEPTSPLSKWLRYWLWYSGGEFRLNYLGISGNKFENEAEAYKKNIAKEVELNEMNKKIVALKERPPYDIKSLDTLEMLQKRASKVKSELEKIAQEKIDFQKTMAFENRFSTTTSIIQSLQLPAESKKGKEHIIYHDALSSYELLKDDKVILPDGYTIYFGIVNAKEENDKALIFTQNEEKFEPKTFNQELTRELGKLGEAAASILPFAGKFGSFASDLFGPVLPLSQQGDEQALRGKMDSVAKNQLKDITAEECSALKNEMSYKLWKWKLLKFMLEEKNYIANEIKEEIDKKPQFYTYARKADEFKVPYTNAYDIKYNDAKILANKFSIGEQKTISLGAGVFFNTNSSRQVTVDTNGGFKITNSDNKAKLVLGMKVYPFKSFEADGGIIPKFWEKRFSLFLGASLPKPQDNLYGGIGYELVPGLHLSSGVHYYKRDIYKVENNQVIDKTSSYKLSGPYLGLTLDPIVFAGILKAFFL